MSRITPTQEEIVRIIADSPVPLNRIDIADQIIRTHKPFVRRPKGTSRMTFVQHHLHVQVLFNHLHVLTARGELTAIKGSVINGDHGSLHQQGVYYFTKDTLAIFREEQDKIEQAVRLAQALERANDEVLARHSDEVEELLEKFLQEQG